MLGFLSKRFLLHLLLNTSTVNFHRESEYTTHTDLRMNCDITLKLLTNLFAYRETKTVASICLLHCSVLTK